MTRRRYRAWLVLLALAGSHSVTGCGETGQTRVALPIRAVGTAPAPFSAGEWEVRLERADVGFGPAYFCATRAASVDRCPTAIAELADSATVDALQDAEQDIGTVRAVTGEVHSAVFDFAYTWLLTQTDPAPAAGAPDGHSARFEGAASRGDRTIHFTADVDIVPLFQGTHAVQGLRTEATIESNGGAVLVRMDPSQWWSQVDFDDVAAGATGDDATVVAGTRGYDALVIAMTSLAPPAFEWSPGAD